MIAKTGLLVSVVAPTIATVLAAPVDGDVIFSIFFGPQGPPSRFCAFSISQEVIRKLVWDPVLPRAQLLYRSCSNKHTYVDQDVQWSR